MGQRYGYLVPLKTLIHGILAAALSFTAYTKRIKAEDVSNFNGYCAYPSNFAWYYGIIAAVALLAGQVTISVGTRCFCCGGVRRSSKCTSIIAIILFIFSWLSFIIAFMGLIYTSVLNNRKFLAKHHSSNNNGDKCFIGQENLFLGAAFWCIITTVSSLIYYALWTCGADNNTNNYAANYDQGVAMGQPRTQLPKEQC